MAHNNQHPPTPGPRGGESFHSHESRQPILEPQLLEAFSTSYSQASSSTDRFRSSRNKNQTTHLVLGIVTGAVLLVGVAPQFFAPATPSTAVVQSQAVPQLPRPPYTQQSFSNARHQGTVIPDTVSTQTPTAESHRDTANTPENSFPSGGGFTPTTTPEPYRPTALRSVLVPWESLEGWALEGYIEETVGPATEYTLTFLEVERGKRSGCRAHLERKDNRQQAAMYVTTLDPDAEPTISLTKVSQGGVSAWTPNTLPATLLLSWVDHALDGQAGNRQKCRFDIPPLHGPGMVGQVVTEQKPAAQRWQELVGVPLKGISHVEGFAAASCVLVIDQILHGGLICKGRLDSADDPRISIPWTGTLTLNKPYPLEFRLQKSGPGTIRIRNFMSNANNSVGVVRLRLMNDGSVVGISNTENFRFDPVESTPVFSRTTTIPTRVLSPEEADEKAQRQLDLIKVFVENNKKDPLKNEFVKTMVGRMQEQTPEAAATVQAIELLATLEAEFGEEAR